jgi:hypothetical protein
MRQLGPPILALIALLLLPLPVAAQESETATLTIHITNNGQLLQNPRHGKFYLYEPGKRDKHVAWARAEGTVTVPAESYDLVVVYLNDTIREERLYEEVSLQGEMELDVGFTIQVAQVNLHLTSGGEPVPRGTARYDIYPAGRRGKPLASRRPGEPAIVREGSYDIEIAFRALEGLQRRWLESFYVTGLREETLEVGTSSARVTITATRDGDELPVNAARWRVYRAGDRETALAERRSGESLVLEPGIYDVGLFFNVSGVRGQRWLVGIEVNGDVRRHIDISTETASLAVTCRRGGSMVDEAWFEVYPAGGNGAPRATGRNGAEVPLEPGSYDVRCAVRRQGLRAEHWMRDQRVSGRAELGVQMDFRTASLRVTPPRDGASRAPGKGTVLLVVDSSAEMAASLGVRTHMEQVAQFTQEAVLGLSGSDVQLGMRVFGIMPPARRDCRDSTLMLPVQPVNTRELARSLRLLRPSGVSPIAYSLEQAAGDLPPGGESVLVLITAGPDSCEGDPCATATELLRSGAVSRIEVVAMGVGLEERGALDCIGGYHAVSSGAQLKQVLRGIFREVLRGGGGTVSMFEPNGGAWIASAPIGERIEVLPGRYDVLIRAGGETWEWKNLRVSGFVEGEAGPRKP